MGRDNAYYMQGAAALICRAAPEHVAVASTGVIGVQLNTRDLSKGASGVSHVLSADGALSFQQSIMTTDLWPKMASLTVELSGGSVVLAAQAKGAGMIAPLHVNHATLLAFIETDAKLSTRRPLTSSSARRCGTVSIA